MNMLRRVGKLSRSRIPAPARAFLSTLPGKLGDSSMTLLTEPRMNPAMLSHYKPDLFLGRYGAVGEALPMPVGPRSPQFLKHAWIDILESVRIRGADGNDITLLVARPKDGGNGHGILHAHGGGMAMMTAETPVYSAYRQWLASRGFTVVGVEFRNSSGSLGPHPFPAGLSDCMCALSWVAEHRESLGVKGSLVLNGESGGGNLCAAMAIRAKRDGRLGEFDGVFSMCPFIAGPDVWSERSLSSLVECDGYFVDMDGFIMCATLYDPHRRHARDPCAWPYHAETSDLEGLPPHVISVNELDPLRDEGLAYHRKLSAAGVQSAGVLIEGTPHGEDLMAMSVPGASHIFEATLARLSDFCDELQADAEEEPLEAAAGTTSAHLH